MAPQEIKHYHLRAEREGSTGFLIEDDGEKLTWADWHEGGYLKMELGPAEIRGEILLMHLGKTCAEPQYKNWPEILAYLNTLPRWTRTKYFLPAFSHWENLSDVKTCNLLPPEVARQILRKHGMDHYK